MELNKIKIADIHSHVLPDVDDGSPDLETSLKLLKDEFNEGVTDIIFTPHYRLDMFLTSAEEDLRVFDSFTKTAKESGINMNFYLGQELHNAPEMLNLVKQGKALTLNNSDRVLLEFSWHVKPENAVDVVKSYLDAGYTPIVAHYERFPYYDVKDVEALKKAGAMFQINAYSLFGVEKAERAENAKQMIANDYVDFVAGDYHKNKKLLLKDAYAFVLKEYGKKTADKLFYLNAKEFLK